MPIDSKLGFRLDFQRLGPWASFSIIIQYIFGANPLKYRDNPLRTTKSRNRNEKSVLGCELCGEEVDWTYDSWLIYSPSVLIGFRGNLYRTSQCLQYISCCSSEAAESIMRDQVHCSTYAYICLTNYPQFSSPSCPVQFPSNSRVGAADICQHFQHLAKLRKLSRAHGVQRLNLAAQTRLLRMARVCLG